MHPYSIQRRPIHIQTWRVNRVDHAGIVVANRAMARASLRIIRPIGIFRRLFIQSAPSYHYEPRIHPAIINHGLKETLVPSEYKGRVFVLMKVVNANGRERRAFHGQFTKTRTNLTVHRMTTLPCVPMLSTVSQRVVIIRARIFSISFGVEVANYYVRVVSSFGIFCVERVSF